MKRQIIKIDESKCTGCGACIVNCAEGSLEIRNGKAVLVKESLCDGLGACIGHCPEGALTIEERDADEFNEEDVKERLSSLKKDEQRQSTASPRKFHHQGGCPSAGLVNLKPSAKAGHAADETLAMVGASALGNWPVQLSLLPPTAPFFRDADLLLSADCAPFAMAAFHQKLLNGKVLAIGCPKLDDADEYYEKLKNIFISAGVKSVAVARMEVPCCGGLTMIAKKALEDSGVNIPMEEIIIRRDGTVA